MKIMNETTKLQIIDCWQSTSQIKMLISAIVVINQDHRFERFIKYGLYVKVYLLMIKMFTNMKPMLRAYYTPYIIATISMTVYCPYQYLKDDDVSNVSFHTFNEKDFFYPVIMFCF